MTQITPEWLAERRAELEAQQRNFLAQYNACNGALQMLSAVEVEMNKPNEMDELNG